MKTQLERLAKVRAEIATLTDARDDTADAAIPRNEAAARVDAVLNAIQADPIHGSSPTGLSNSSFNITDALKMFDKPGLLVELLREPLKVYLLEVFDAEAGETTGLPAGERRKRLAELAGQIFKLEVAEEAIIEELEAAGTDVQRRADASPIAQLGLSPSVGEAA